MERDCLFSLAHQVQVTSVTGFWFSMIAVTTQGLFLNEKSDLKLNVLALIKELKAKHGYAVKYIQCDNEGENLTLEMAC